MNSSHFSAQVRTFFEILCSLIFRIFPHNLILICVNVSSSKCIFKLHVFSFLFLQLFHLYSQFSSQLLLFCVAPCIKMGLQHCLSAHISSHVSCLIFKIYAYMVKCFCFFNYIFKFFIMVLTDCMY
jgi:hypothetical protein